MNNLEDNDTLTQRIIGCAIEVHRTLGPGSDFASSLPRGHPRHRLLSPFVLSTPSQNSKLKPAVICRTRGFELCTPNEALTLNCSLSGDQMPPPIQGLPRSSP